MGKVLPSLLLTSRSTVRLHSASDPRLRAFSLSEGKAGYHVAFHLLRKYNARHLSPQGRFRSPATDASTAG